MAVFETWIESDLQKMIVPRALPGNAFCMDSGANLIGVSVMDGGEPATLSGTVAGKVVRSDGTTVPVAGGTLSGNRASIILPQRAYEVPGPIAIAVTLTSGSTVTTIGAVTGYVVRSQTDSIIDPGTILPTIDTLINQIQTAIDSIPADYSQVIHSIAPSFSSSTAYSAGDMVWYPGEATNPGALYRFTSAHAAGEWTGTDATAAVFANELSALKSAFDNITPYRNLSTPWTHTSVNSSNIIVTSTLVNSIYFEAKPDYVYLFNAVGNMNRFALYGVNGNVATLIHLETANAVPNPCSYTFTNSAGYAKLLLILYYGDENNRNVTITTTESASSELPEFSVAGVRVLTGDDLAGYATKSELYETNANVLERYFILENDSYNAEYSDLYLQRLGAIHYIKLVGFEQYTKCRLRLIARNHSTFHYRFIIAGYNGTSWVDVFDTGSSFTVTENANGDTYVTAAVGTKSVEMYINYSKFPNNFSWNESTPTGSYRYIFSQNVYGKADENDVIPDIYFTKNSNENFDIVYHYSDTENVMIKFSPIGVNNLFAPHYLYKRTATKNEPVFSGYTTWDTIGTDWVSPYQGIIENDPSVSSGITVGGNHGTNGSSGFPTAQRISIVAYADGKETELNKIYGCKEVKIIVKSNIAASNTINLETGEFDPAMIETIVWTVTKNNFEVCVYLDALKNISIKGYTGLQMTAGFNPAVYFNDGTGQKSITGAQIDAISYPTFSGNRSVILDTVNGDLRIVYTNRQVGIGDLSHITSGNPTAYVSTNRKLYQHLVNTIPLDLQAGETACYSGGYTLMKSYECVGAKEAYFISYNGEKQYCVDFLESGSCYAKLPAKLIGHQIEVVAKDDVVTIDPIVSGNGVHVVSTGIGSVCFNVK